MPLQLNRSARQSRTFRQGRTELVILTAIVTVLLLLYVLAEIAPPTRSNYATSLGLGISLEDLMVRIVLVVVACCLSIRMFATQR